MLKSVNTSTALVSDQIKQSKIGNVVHVGNLLREHAANLGEFLMHECHRLVSVSRILAAYP